MNQCYRCLQDPPADTETGSRRARPLPGLVREIRPRGVPDAQQHSVPSPGEIHIRGQRGAPGQVGAPPGQVRVRGGDRDDRQGHQGRRVRGQSGSRLPHVAGERPGRGGIRIAGGGRGGQLGRLL